MDDTTLDGNAAGGILREVFPFEMTIAEATCEHCGATRTVGELTVYKSAIGTQIRCPYCDHAPTESVSNSGRYWLDMQVVGLVEHITALQEVQGSHPDHDKQQLKARS